MLMVEDHPREALCVRRWGCQEEKTLFTLAYSLLLGTRRFLMGLAHSCGPAAAVSWFIPMTDAKSWSPLISTAKLLISSATISTGSKRSLTQKAHIPIAAVDADAAVPWLPALRLCSLPHSFTQLAASLTGSNVAVCVDSLHLRFKNDWNLAVTSEIYSFVRKCMIHDGCTMSSWYGPVLQKYSQI